MNRALRLLAAALLLHLGAVTIPVRADESPDPDGERPEVQITQPQGGQQIDTTFVDITAEASDNVGVARVEFYVRDTLIVADTETPYAARWDTRTYEQGSARIQAVAYDQAGNQRQDSVFVDVQREDRLLRVSPDGRYGIFEKNRSDSGEEGALRLREMDSNNLIYEKLLGRFRLHPSGSANIPRLPARTEFTPDGRHIGVLLDDDSFDGAYLVFRTGDGGSVIDFDGGDPSRYIDIDEGSIQLADNSVTLSYSFGSDGEPRHTRTLNFDGTPDPDTVPPTVSIASPRDGALVSGAFEFAADAADDRGIRLVEFYVDGVLYGSDDSAPYAASVDSRILPNGSHTLTARAYDLSNNAAEAAIRAASFNLLPPPQKDPVPPAVSFVSPSEGAQLNAGALFTVEAEASDNIGVTRVEFSFEDGKGKAVLTTTPYRFQANPQTIGLAAGPHTLTATAFDNAGNSAAATVRFSLKDAGAPPSGTAQIGPEGGFAEDPALGASVLIPPGALTQPSQVTFQAVSLLPAWTDAASRQGLSPIGTAVDFRLAGRDSVQFARPVEVSLAYPAGQVRDARRLVLGWWDPGQGGWQVVPGSKADSAKGRVSGSVDHFTIFMVMEGSGAGPGLGQVFVYPNPARNPQSPIFHMETPGAMDKVEVRIYDLQGQLVEEKLMPGPAKPGANGQLGYEVNWDPGGAATGSYIAHFAATKDGQTATAIRKFAIIR